MRACLMLCGVLAAGACTPSADANDELRPMTIDAWKASHTCPPGARHDVIADDSGRRVYCLLSDDTKQGPWAEFEATGQQVRGGVYDHDVQQLLLTWDSKGTIMSREVLRADGKQDVTTWDRNGKPTTHIQDD